MGKRQKKAGQSGEVAKSGAVAGDSGGVARLPASYWKACELCAMENTRRLARCMRGSSEGLESRTRGFAA